MLSSNKLKENLLQRKEKKGNDLLANQRRPYESCYMTHLLEQLNEQLLLVIVSYIIYNFFFFVMLCYFLLY